MDWTITRAKTRGTRGTEGFACIGFTCVNRHSPRSGTHAISLGPAKAAHQKMRPRLTYVPSRRAPSSPKECVALGKPRVTGGGHDGRHTNASQAFRGLQRFVNIRLRRSLPQRRKGRGFGGHRVPNSKLSAMGLASLGSGMLTYQATPAHDVRCSLSARRTRAN
jgi:RNA-directed DNA polymerase